VDPSIINYQRLRPSIHPRGPKSDYLIGPAGVHLFNDCNIHMSSSVWVPLSDNNW